jgi:ABC-type amino acid transport substrate-binding protein
LRTAKVSLLLASLALVFIQCGEKKVTHDAMAAIAKNKMVRIATDPVNLPFEFGLGTDVQGFDVDLGAEIAKDIGQPVKWIKVSYDRIFEVLKEGGVEMVISTVAITDEIKKDLVFSEAYFDSSNTIARRRDNQAIKDLASLSGKPVGVQAGRTGDFFMATQKTATGTKLSKFKTLDDALGALNRGELDAVVGDKPIITYSIYKSYATNLITTGVELLPIQYGVVLRQNDTVLLGKVNDTIARLKSAGALEGNRQKWLQDVMKITADERDALAKEELLKQAPKSITVNFVKEAGNTVVRLDRLEGFDAQLAGPGGSFKSTPIIVDEALVRGSCKFATPIPAGEYTITLSRISLKAPLTVEKKAVTAMTLVVTFTSKNGMEMVWK